VRGENRSLNAPPRSMKAARDRRGHQDGAEDETGTGQLEREPGEGDEMELVAEDADRLPAEEEAEVADAQRPNQRGAGLR
jgi:hypothetical protein